MLSQVGTLEIVTSRLVLRRFQDADGPDMLKNWASDPDIQSLYLEPTYTTMEQVQHLLASYQQAYSCDSYYRWAIIERQSMECIGQIAYFLVNEQHRFAEIEYCIGKSFQNQGLASEATKALLAFGFEKMNLNKVQICHRVPNLASQKVIKNCGLQFEGILRSAIYHEGEYFDRAYYSLLRSEYTSHQSKSSGACARR